MLESSKPSRVRPRGFIDAATTLLIIGMGVWLTMQAVRLFPSAVYL